MPSPCKVSPPLFIPCTAPSAPNPPQWSVWGTKATDDWPRSNLQLPAGYGRTRSGRPPSLGHWQGMTAWLRAWSGACIDWTRGSDLNPWTWPRGRGVVYLFFLLSSSLLWLVRAFVGSLQQHARYMSGIGWAFLVGRGMRKKFMNSAPVAPIALLCLRRCRSGSIGVYPDGPTTIHRLAP